MASQSHTIGRRYWAQVPWWAWAKVVGAVGVVAVLAALAVGLAVAPLIIAVVMHFLTDFTLQSDETSQRKPDRGRHLFAHALAAGGLPLALAGIWAGNPLAVVTWAIIGAGLHYLVDWTHKLGIKHVVFGVLLDQIAHLVVIIVLTLPASIAWMTRN